MEKRFECKKCKERYPVEGFVFRDGGLGTEWDVVPPCRRCRRDKVYRDRYGISLREVEDRLQAQGFTCGICVMKVPSVEVGCIDMDHANAKLRGILCEACSWLLRKSKLSPVLLHGAASYLEKHDETVSKAQYTAAGTRPY